LVHLLGSEQRPNRDASKPRGGDGGGGRTGKDAFPDAQLRKEMASRGKSLAFVPAEIEDLLSMQYGDKRLFGLLSSLFTFVDLRNQFHMDHVFPISRFTAARLKRAGVPDDKVGKFAELAAQLPNLQLLEGPANIEKRAKLPADWLTERYPLAKDRDHYRSIHMLGDVPSGLEGFDDFWNERRERLRELMTKVLNQQEENGSGAVNAVAKVG
jgi:hypothetical protein